MSQMCLESPYLQGKGAKQTRGGSRVLMAREAGGADTPFPPPPPPPHLSPYPHHPYYLFPDCTANCKTCQGSFCSVCEQGHALYKGFGGFDKGRCLRKCPKGYKTVVNPSGGNKCVRCKYHKLCSIYLKAAVARHQALISCLL